MDKTATIATALLLTAISVALALWADVLKIQITAYTGNVDVEFGTATVTEYVGFPDGNGGWSFVPEGSTSEAKNVGQCAATFTEVENEEQGSPSNAGNNDADLVITITNGYPGFRCRVVFTVVNTGTVPVKGPTVVDPSNNPIVKDGVEVKHNITTNNCKQLHPGDTQTFEINATVLQQASESTTTTIQIHIRYDQWNEAQCGPPPPQQQPNMQKDFTTSGGTPLETLGGYRAIGIVVNNQGKISSPDHVIMVVLVYLPQQVTATSSTPLVIKDYLPPDWYVDPASGWDNAAKMCYSPNYPTAFPNYPFSTPCTWSGASQVYPQFSYTGGVLEAKFTSGTYGPGYLVMFIKALYALQGQQAPSGYFTPVQIGNNIYYIHDFTNKAEAWLGNTKLADASAVLRGYKK